MDLSRDRLILELEQRIEPRFLGLPARRLVSVRTELSWFQLEVNLKYCILASYCVKNNAFIYVFFRPHNSLLVQVRVY
jgi:hypothetical protein